MLKNILRKENRFELISWILFIGVFIFTCIFFERKITGQLNADSSSEMVLSKLLADNGNIMLSPKWDYSTELRVLNVQIVWGLLFRIISNWHVVRVIGTIIWWIIMLLSVCGLCSALKLKKYYPLIGMCFLLPISGQIYGFYLIDLWYMTHVIITINLLTLSFKYLNANNKRTRITSLVLGFVLAFFAGLGGVRHIMVYVIPLILAMFFYGVREYNNNTKIVVKDYYYTIISSLGVLIGFITNEKVLRHFYHFDGYGSNTFTAFDFNRLFDIFNGFLNTSGYVSGTRVLSLNLIKNGYALLIVCICIYSIYKTFKKKNELSNVSLIMNYFFVFGMITMTLIQTMTSTIYQPRYFLPVYMFIIILVFNIINNEQDNVIKKALLFTFVVCYLVSGLLTFNASRNNTGNYNKQEVTKFLLDNNYLNGYSFFWDSNDITELSNGKIDVWSWGFISSTPEDFKEVYYYSPWLQNRDHIGQTPQGKVFILLSNEANEKFKDLVFFIDKQRVYQNDDYIVYGFNSFEEMKEIMHF